jgi:hypothetical protein
MRFHNTTLPEKDVTREPDTATQQPISFQFFQALVSQTKTFACYSHFVDVYDVMKRLHLLQLSSFLQKVGNNNQEIQYWPNNSRSDDKRRPHVLLKWIHQGESFTQATWSVR